MEIISFTYSPSIINDDELTGVVVFKDLKGKIHKQEYITNTIVGDYLVRNIGSKVMPNLKVYKMNWR